MSRRAKNENTTPTGKPAIIPRIRNVTLGRFGSGTVRTSKPQTTGIASGKGTGNDDGTVDPGGGNAPPVSPGSADPRAENIRATVIDQIGRVNVRNHLPPRLPSAIAGPSAGMRRGSPLVAAPERPTQGYFSRNPGKPATQGYNSKPGGGKTGHASATRKATASLNTIFPPHQPASMTGSVTDSQMFPYANMTAPKKNEFSTFNVKVENQMDPKALESFHSKRSTSTKESAKANVEARAINGNEESGIMDISPPSSFQNAMDYQGNGLKNPGGGKDSGYRSPGSRFCNIKPKTADSYWDSAKATESEESSRTRLSKTGRKPPLALPFWAVGGASSEMKRAEELKRPFSAPTRLYQHPITEIDFLEALTKPYDYEFRRDDSRPLTVDSDELARESLTETELLHAALKESLQVSSVTEQKLDTSTTHPVEEASGEELREEVVTQDQPAGRDSNVEGNQPQESARDSNVEGDDTQESTRDSNLGGDQIQESVRDSNIGGDQTQESAGDSNVEGNQDS